MTMYARFPILWLTGNSGAGKTTLAVAAREYFNEREHEGVLHRRVVVLDGDEMRSSISTAEGLSPEDRRAHNLRVARLAKVLQSQGFLVVVAVIAPFQQVRGEIDAICFPLWIYVERSGLRAPDRPYEPPTDPAWTICNDTLSREEAVGSFLGFISSQPSAPAHPGKTSTSTRSSAAC